MHVLLRTILQEQKCPFSSYVIYYYFYHGIFIFWIDSVEELPSAVSIANIFYTRIKKVPNFLATNRYNLENKG